MVEFIEPLLDEVPIDINYRNNMTLSEKIYLGKELLKVGKLLGKLGDEIPDFFELLLAPASKLLDKWFESEPLKYTLATDAVVGAYVSP